MESIFYSRLPEIATARNETLKSLKVIIEEKSYNLKHYVEDSLCHFRVFSWNTSANKTEAYMYPNYWYESYSRPAYRESEDYDSSMIETIIGYLKKMGFSYKNVIDSFRHTPEDYFSDLSLSVLFAMAAAQLVENKHNIKCKYMIRLAGCDNYTKTDSWFVEQVNRDHEKDDTESVTFEVAFNFDTDLPHKDLAALYDSEYQNILNEISKKPIAKDGHYYGSIDASRFIRSYKEYKTKPRAKKKPESFEITVSKDFSADAYILDFLKEKGLMDELYNYKVKYFTEINKPNVLKVSAEVMLGDADGSENDTQVIPLKYFDLIADWIEAYSKTIPKNEDPRYISILEVGNEHLSGDWSWEGVRALFGIGKKPGYGNFDNGYSSISTDYAVWDNIDTWNLAESENYEDVMNDENDTLPDSWDHNGDLVFKLFCYACYWDKHKRAKSALVPIK